MSRSHFVIPVHLEELLQENDHQYFVQKLYSKAEISKYLKAANQLYREVGPTFILDCFDTYFSVVEDYNELPRVLVLGAFDDIRKSLLALPAILQPFTQDKETEIDFEIKAKIQQILKMTIFLYVQLFQCLEESYKVTTLVHKSKKRKTKGADDNLRVDWTETLYALKILFQVDLHMFWDSAGVESSLLRVVVDLTMTILEDSMIKSDRKCQEEVWALYSLLVADYEMGDIIAMRCVRLVKENEYLVSIFTECITHLVRVFDLKQFFVLFLNELTHWQIEETVVESKGARHCANLVVELAKQLPKHMLGMMEYFCNYLRCTSIQLRAMVLGVMVEMLIEGTRSEQSLPAAEVNDWMIVKAQILTIFEKYTDDSAPLVRARTFTHLTRLVEEEVIPANRQQAYLEKAVKHLRDVSGAPRKAAAQCVIQMLTHNRFGHKISLRERFEEYSRRAVELLELKYQIYGISLEEQRELEDNWHEIVPELTKVLLQHLKDMPAEEKDQDGDNENDDGTENSSDKDEGVEICDEVESQESGETNEELPSGHHINEDTTTPNVEDLIRADLINKDYTAAVGRLPYAMKTSKNYQAMKTQKGNDLTQDQLLLFFLRAVHSKIFSISHPQPSVEQAQELSQLEKMVIYCKECVKFLESLQIAIAHMIRMLTSTLIGDMQVAVEFIILAYQFQLDSASDGINTILKIVSRNEEDRKRIAGNALKTIYLTSDGNDLNDHAKIVTEKLITLYRGVKHDTFDSLGDLLSLWASKGELSNDIIDGLWNCVLMKFPVSQQNSRIALCILQLATSGRKSIVERNIHVLIRVCFQERGHGEPYLVLAALDMLRKLGDSEVPATSQTPGFRLSSKDELWPNVTRILKHYMKKRTPIFNCMILSAMRMIFSVHENPLNYLRYLVKAFLLNMPANGQIHRYHVVRYYVFVGALATCSMRYLDTDVYSELKRRHYQKSERDNEENAKIAARKGKARHNMSLVSNASALNQTGRSALDIPENGVVDMDVSTMDGAEANDTDLEFITHILQDSLNVRGAVGQLYKPVISIDTSIVQQPELIQMAALMALARGMLMSGAFCEKHVRKFFFIMLKTQYPQVKVMMLVHIVDLLERFPNAIDPYMNNVYELLKSKNVLVRHFTLSVISMLILKDMHRPQENIWRLAECLADEPPIAACARAFFRRTLEKSTKLYCFIPDIFMSLCINYNLDTDKSNKENDASGIDSQDKSRLSTNNLPPPEKENPVQHATPEANTNKDATDINREKFQMILRYLIALVDKPKEIEMLIERFCLKFVNCEGNQPRSIAFVLTLMPCNDRNLRKLIENFPKFNKYVLDQEVYECFKAICAKAKTKEVKTVAADLEDMMDEMFKVDGKRPPRIITKNKPPPRKKAKTPLKNGRPTASGRRKTTRVTSSSSDESDYDSDDNSKKRRRARRIR